MAREAQYPHGLTSPVIVTHPPGQRRLLSLNHAYVFNTTPDERVERPARRACFTSRRTIALDTLQATLELVLWNGGCLGRRPAPWACARVGI